MAFRIEELRESDLAGGSIADIVSAVVVPTKAWTKHLAKVKREGAKTCKVLQAALGQPVPKELAEWLDVEGPRGIPEPYDSGWYTACEPTLPTKGRAEKALVKSPLVFLTGLVPFARDASGDQAFVSVRPHPLDVAEVYGFDHEVGEIDGLAGNSIADFLVEKWVSDDENDPDDEYVRPGFIGKLHRKVAAAQKAFEARAKKALKQRPAHLDPEALWARSHWLFGLIAGEPGFRFPEMLAKAPPLAVWTKEKASLAKEPQLAIYWMLAHLFFGNDDACREAAKLAKKSKGWAIVEIAASFEAFLDGKKKTPLALLTPKALADGRALVAKNALPAQLGKKKAPSSRMEDEILAKHDEALRAFAKSDASKRGLIESYFEEREDEAYNHWPYEGKLDEMLVAPAAAAFRAGLAVDLGHPRAFAGVSRALAGRVDHPEARAALIDALAGLAPDDDRLGHVLEALLSRDEAEVQEALRAAAWRWLERAGGIDEVLAKRQARRTLDDMVAEDDLLQPAVHAVLERCDEEAEKLALAIADKKLSFRVLGRTVGYVFRVYGKRGLRDRAERLRAFLGFLDVVPGSTNEEEPGVALDTTASVALAEASLALARLDPEGTKKLVDGMLARERSGDVRRAGVAASILPAILHLDPNDAEGLRWLERVLGARGGPPWIYGGLLAAREAKIERAAPWILPHAYSRSLNSIMDEFEVLEDEARKTLAAIGAPAPPFDEQDKFAREVPQGELGAALLRNDRYDTGAVLKRIREAKMEAAMARPVGAFLEDRFRFTRYEPESHFISDDLRVAIEILKSAGAEGKKELESLAKLPEIGEWAKEML